MEIPQKSFSPESESFVTSVGASVQSSWTESGVSVVVPLFNEAESLVELFDRVRNALQGVDFEVIFVDDGSNDESWSVICDLKSRHPECVAAIRHRRNFGKAEALASGFGIVGKPFVVTMDADLQDDPNEIPALLHKLQDGFDVVSGWKKDRHDPVSKTLPSKVFNAAARVISGLSLHDFNCGLKAYRRESILDLHLYGEMHRFVPILLHSEGYRVTELPVRHFPRQHGQSKYGWERFLKGGLDLASVVLLTRYLNRPGHFFGILGMIIGIAGMGILAYLSFNKLIFGVNIGPRPLFFLGILSTLFAAQLISIGFIGEFILRQKTSGNRGSRIAEVVTKRSK